MDLSPHIFREYDIRGIVGQDLDPQVCRQVGRAFASVVRETVANDATLIVGRDNRPHSPQLSEGLVDGLRTAGANVVDLGTVPTPLVLWGEHRLEAHGGIQITGSHNPSEYNGIKMTLQGRSP
jgi:phosphomannomutase/phosphoglucomutase